jgi:transcriptional regulator with XRE-family HTH domain
MSAYLTFGGGMMDLKGYRRSKNMTQLQLAEAVGVKRSTVAMWETGKSVPRTTQLSVIAKVLDVPIERLLQTFYREAS